MSKDSYKKVKTRLGQKMILALGGFLFTFLFLEIGLRLGGFSILCLQELRNTEALRRKSQYCVLCLGESTTQGEYPPFLEKILNQNSKGVSFSVIDKGTGGTNTGTIVSELDSYLDKYHPDLVVTMMGINDYGDHMPYQKDLNSNPPSFIHSLKIFKLARLLWLHGITKAKQLGLLDSRKKAYPNKELRPEFEGPVARSRLVRHELSLINITKTNPQDDRAYAELGLCYRDQGDRPRAIEYFSRALKLNPRSDKAWVGLAWCYKDQGDRPRAIEYFSRALRFNPKNDSVYTELAWCYEEEGRFAIAKRYFTKAITLNKMCCWSYIGLALCYKEQGNYDKAKSILLDAIQANPTHPDRARLYGCLGIICKDAGDYVNFEFYLKRANALRNDYLDFATAKNYVKLKTILDARKIRLICVQYPMRSILPLQRLFEGEPGISFVDNEEIFRKAVWRDGYKEYFRDCFGGDFGHCTPKGNRILAENIAQAIWKQVFNKQSL